MTILLNDNVNIWSLRLIYTASDTLSLNAQLTLEIYNIFFINMAK